MNQLELYNKYQLVSSRYTMIPSNLCTSCSSILIGSLSSEIFTLKTYPDDSDNKCLGCDCDLTKPINLFTEDFVIDPTPDDCYQEKPNEYNSSVICDDPPSPLIELTNDCDKTQNPKDSEPTISNQNSDYGEEDTIENTESNFIDSLNSSISDTQDPLSNDPYLSLQPKVHVLRLPDYFFNSDETATSLDQLYSNLTRSLFIREKGCKYRHVFRKNETIQKHSTAVSQLNHTQSPKVRRGRRKKIVGDVPSVKQKISLDKNNPSLSSQNADKSKDSDGLAEKELPLDLFDILMTSSEIILTRAKMRLIIQNLTSSLHREDLELNNSYQSKERKAKKQINRVKRFVRKSARLRRLPARAPLEMIRIKKEPKSRKLETKSLENEKEFEANLSVITMDLTSDSDLIDEMIFPTDESNDSFELVGQGQESSTMSKKKVGDTVQNNQATSTPKIFRKTSPSIDQEISFKFDQEIVEAFSDRWITSVKKYNNWPGDALVTWKATHQINEDEFKIVLIIDSQTKSAIEKFGGKIDLGGFLVEVVYEIGVRQCQNCLEYDKCYRTGCNNPKRCHFCARTHKTECITKEIPDQWFCFFCKVKGHSATSPDCPVFINKLKFNHQIGSNSSVS